MRYKTQWGWARAHRKATRELRAAELTLFNLKGWRNASLGVLTWGSETTSGTVQQPVVITKAQEEAEDRYNAAYAKLVAIENARPPVPLRGSVLVKIDSLMEMPEGDPGDSRVCEASSVLGTPVTQFLRHPAVRKRLVQLAVLRMWRYHAPEKFAAWLKQHGTQIGVTSRRGNTLYRLVHTRPAGAYMRNPRTDYYLVYNCPSTGKVYVSGVLPHVFGGRWVRNKADRAMAWKLRMTLTEYNQLRIEA